MAPVPVYFSVATEDASVAAPLVEPFETLARQGCVTLSYPVGAAITEIRRHEETRIDAARLILILLSEGHLASAQCRAQMERALRRHRGRRARVALLAARPGDGRIPAPHLVFLPGEVLEWLVRAWPLRDGHEAWTVVSEAIQASLAGRPLPSHGGLADMAVREVAPRAAPSGEALWDLAWLQRETATIGVDAVLAALRAESERADPAARPRIDALLRPLDREADALRGWDPARAPGFFLQQLRNQCLELGIDDVRARAEAMLEEQRWPWLRERFPTGRASRALVRTLRGHAFFVTDVAVTPDGRFAVSASLDHTLRVWEAATGRLVHTLEGHTDYVQAVAVTRDGRRAVSLAEDLTLKVWDIDTGKLVRNIVMAPFRNSWAAYCAGEPTSLHYLAVTPDGRLAVAGSFNDALKVWDLETGELVHTLRGPAAELRDVAVMGSGRLLIAAFEDGPLAIWDLHRGELVRTLEGQGRVAVSADGRIAVCGTPSENALKVLDLETGRTIHTLEGHVYPVSRVILTEDGRLAISASRDRTLRLWDLRTGEALCMLEGHTGAIRSVAVTADGRHAVSASEDTTVRVWDLHLARGTAPVGPPSGQVNAIAVTADGRLAISGADDDHDMRVWDLRTGQVVRRLEGHAGEVHGVAMTADGRRAVSASLDGTLGVWDVRTGQLVRKLEGHTEAPRCVALSGDGRLAISDSGSDPPTVWDVDTGQAVHTLERIADSEDLAMTHDGRLAVLGGDSLIVCDVTTRKTVFHLQRSPRDRHDGVAKNERFAIAAGLAGSLKIWDMATNEEVSTLEPCLESSAGIALANEGRLAICGSSSGAVKIWDLGTGQLLRVLEGQATWLSAVAATRGGRFVAATTGNDLLELWDTETAERIATLATQVQLRCCAMTPDGKTLVAGDISGALHVLDWMPGPPAPDRTTFTE